MTNKKINVDINFDSDLWSSQKNLKETIRQAVLATLLQTNIASNDFYISIMLTNDNAIKKINHKYRGKDKATNVLSFPYESYSISQAQQKSDFFEMGDLAFAYETIQLEAKNENKSFTDHFTHLVVHGTLHILGFDHENDDDAEIMEKKEIEILNILEIKNPY